MYEVKIGQIFKKKKYEIEDIRLCNHTSLYPYGEEIIENGDCYFYYIGDCGTIHRAKLDKDDTAHELNDYNTEVEVEIVGLLPTRVEGCCLFFGN